MKNNKKSIQKLTSYDNIADVYTKHVERKLSWNNIYERPFMESIFDSFTNKCVLDVGCGSGYYSYLALNKGAIVTAVDISKKMIELSSQNIKAKKIKFLQSDITNGIPKIKSNSQDYIVCSLVLHYIEKWDNILED